jgi:hypothetical protein
MAKNILTNANVNVALMNSQLNYTNFGDDPIESVIQMHYYTLKPDLCMNYNFKIRSITALL